jgi:hypothetical protein
MQASDVRCGKAYTIAAAEREILQRPHKVGGAPQNLRSSLLFPSLRVSRGISCLSSRYGRTGSQKPPGRELRF